MEIPGPLARCQRLVQGQRAEVVTPKLKERTGALKEPVKRLEDFKGLKLRSSGRLVTQHQRLC